MKTNNKTYNIYKNINVNELEIVICPCDIEYLSADILEENIAEEDTMRTARLLRAGYEVMQPEYDCVIKIINA